MCAAIFASDILLAQSGASAPVAGNVELSQDDSELRKITVSYTLSSEAIVTVDFQTNVLEDASGEWVSIGAKTSENGIRAVSEKSPSSLTYT
jgi:hypothetical protein